MNRSQKILIGLLGLQVVLILLVRAPFVGSTGTSDRQSLFPGLGEAVVSRLQFEGGEGQSLTVRKEGDAWVVEEAGGYPADGGKVGDLLETLGGLEVRRPVVTSGRYHKSFKVAERENEGRVRVWAEGQDTPTADLILGSSPNYRALNVRRAGEDAVYEVGGLASYDVSADASFWVDKQLIDVPENELTGIELTNTEGTIALEKRDGVWFAAAPADLVGKALDPSKVDTLLRQACSIRVDAPAGALDEAAQGLGSPAAVVVLRWQPGGVPPTPAEGEAAAETPAEPAREMTVRIGAPVADKDSQRYVVRSGFGFASTIWESSVRNLLEQKADELL